MFYMFKYTNYKVVDVRMSKRFYGVFTEVLHLYFCVLHSNIDIVDKVINVILNGM